MSAILPEDCFDYIARPSDNGRVRWCAIAFCCAAAMVGLGAAPARICFREIAETAGLRFVMDNGATPEKRMIETMPGGLAVFDYDGDGLPDIFITNGATVPALKKSDPKYYNRLFRNEGNMKFRDVTESAGVAGEGYSMGAAVGDYDNDGRPDLFVTGVYHNALYRNLGNGKFEDVTAKAGIKSTEWSVAAGFFDLDNDGRLDLIVVNYGTWNAATEPYCGDRTRGIRVYCHPKYYDPRPNQLYRNKGDGTFEDVSESSGISAHKGRAMGVSFADYDRDGKMDVYVTNDKLPNFLFHNKGGGKFEEVGLAAGAALLDTGKAISSMGCHFRDYDNDGWPDIVTVALNQETFPIFHNEKNGTFRDATYDSKLGSLSAVRGGWGPVLADFDNDGWKDLFSSNAHVNDMVERFEPFAYKQPNSVFVNLANGQFADSGCESLKREARAHRGVGAADFDGDGKLDVVVSSLGDRAELWQNVSPGTNHWIALRLEGTKSNRDGIGAVVHIGNQWNTMSAPEGYSSSTLTPLHFGLGTSDRVPSIEVRWPSGAVQTLKDVVADRVVVVKEPR